MNKRRNIFKAACIQLNSNNDMIRNIEVSINLIDSAINKKADFIFLPENSSMMAWGKKNIVSSAMSEDDHIALKAYKNIARVNSIWLNCGSLTILLNDGSIVNRSYLINSSGEINSHYDKIHMFDVDLGNGQAYFESSTYTPGKHLSVSSSPWGNVGLTICYDLRFPYLYRDIAKLGAKMICVPSAFTLETGTAHWHTLLRARAIETGAFIFAPAQVGDHSGLRQTFGHSLIVDPWGVILADAGVHSDIIFAEIDIEKSDIARNKIPSLSHDRNYEF